MRKLSSTLTAMTLLMLTGCVDNEPVTSKDKRLADAKTLEQILAHKGSSGEKAIVKEGIKALLAGEYEKASKSFNIALVDDPTNSWLHTLNGMSYQLLARSGDVTQLEVAEAGYKQALKFEPTNSIASLQLGRVKKQQKNYKQAQEEFANVLLLDPENVNALYELASASYYLGDIKTARVAIERYIKAAPNKADAYRAAGIIMAASGKSDEASNYIKKYDELTTDKTQAEQAKRRTEDWKKLYDKGIIMLAQAQEADAPSGDAQPDANAADGSANDQSDKKTAKAEAAVATGPQQMVAIDAVVMRVSEEGITKKGHNILTNFSLTLAPGTKFFAKSKGRSAAPNFTGSTVFPAMSGSDKLTGIPTIGAAIDAGSGLSTSRLLTRGISWGSVYYSLNIANAVNQRIKVLDRPSVTTVVGKHAEFFSGADLTLGLSGQYGGNIAKTPTGITLKVTPLSITNDRILLEIEIHGSIVPAESELDVNVQQSFLPIRTSYVKTTVEMKLGETLMLGGINTQEDQNTKDGVPLLQDIPAIQYFFSEETTDSLRKSVTFLITPRSHEKNMADIKDAFSDPHFGEPSNLTELEIRNKDWFAPYKNNNQVTILKYSAPLYREFRTTDIMPVVWWQDEDFNEQITQIASFLYY